MTSIRGSILMGVMIVALSGSGAMAADLNGGSIKDGYIPAPPTMSAPSASWYVRLDGGHSRFDDPIMVEDHIYDLVDTGIESTWSIGGGIGRHLRHGFRFDVTYDYRMEADAHGFLQNHAALLDGTREFGPRPTSVAMSFRPRNPEPPVTNARFTHMNLLGSDRR